MNNDYEIVSLPYGPEFDADEIRDLIYKKVFLLFL